MYLLLIILTNRHENRKIFTVFDSSQYSLDVVRCSKERVIIMMPIKI